jgi:glycosyltransferase involved in cell wall biosynthesis
MARWWDVARGLPPGTNESAASLLHPLREELRDFGPDVVHVTSGRLGGLAGALRNRPTVLAALDAWHLNVAAEATIATGAKRWALTIEGKLVRRFERQLYARFARVVVVSEEDRRALLLVAPQLRIEVIPNGVDANAFDWDGTPRDRNLILFTGVMSYAPNVTAAEFLARRILPWVRRARPLARVALVGRDPAPVVRALADVPGVEVIGQVPDLQPWLSRAGVYACPMVTGTGMKNKLLEAMANGLPCVATPLAMQGLEATSGNEVLTGSTPEELGGLVVRLFQESELADRIGAAGRAYVRSHHTWGSVAEAYSRVYREVVKTT